MKNFLTLILVMVGLACHGAGLTVASTNGSAGSLSLYGTTTNVGGITKGIVQLRLDVGGSFLRVQTNTITGSVKDGFTFIMGKTSFAVSDSNNAVRLAIDQAGTTYLSDTNGTVRLLLYPDGSLYVNSNQTNTGTLQAAFFVGDGSQITGLPASGFATNYTGVLNLTNFGNRFGGDGQLLTNIQASSIVGGTISTNQTVIVNKTFTIGALETNTYGVPIYISDVSVVGVEAGVVGNSTLIFSNQTSKIVFNQVTAIGGIAGNVTNGLSMLCVSNGTVYGFFDGSSGAGNSVSVTAGKISYTPNIVIGTTVYATNILTTYDFSTNLFTGTLFNMASNSVSIINTATNIYFTGLNYSSSSSGRWGEMVVKAALNSNIIITNPPEWFTSDAQKSRNLFSNQVMVISVQAIPGILTNASFGVLQ